VKELETEKLGRRFVAPPVIVVTVEPTVVPLNVRVRSQANLFSPARETGWEGELETEALLPGKNHWVIRSGRAGTAMVLRVSGEGREREERRDGIVRELAVDGESLVEKGESVMVDVSLGSMSLGRGVWGSDSEDERVWVSAWFEYVFKERTFDSQLDGSKEGVLRSSSRMVVSMGFTREKCGIKVLAMRTGAGESIG
jgi:hypothetical protein